MRCWTENNKILLSVLIVSAALNVVSVGFYAGHCLFGKGPSREHIMKERIDTLLMLLPKSSHKEVRDALEDENAEVGKIFQQMAEERRIIQNLVGARRLDEQELSDAFGRLRQLFAQSQREYHEAFAHAVAKLPYAERHRVKQKMRKRHHDGGNSSETTENAKSDE